MPLDNLHLTAAPARCRADTHLTSHQLTHQANELNCRLTATLLLDRSNIACRHGGYFRQRSHPTHLR